MATAAVWVSELPAREALPALQERHQLDVIALISSAEHASVLARALQLIGSGEAQLLGAERLELIVGSLRELAALLQWLEQAGAHLLVADSGLDTREAGGALAASLLCRLAAWERERPGARRGPGRPGLAERNPQLHALIGELQARGMGPQAIARQLNEAGIPTPRGGKRWRPSSVQAALGYRRPEPLLRGAPPLPPPPHDPAARARGPAPKPPRPPRPPR
ncbi:MAG TPA: recombinase family protein [Solirubrobacteraceae bacterium]|nr:recombinase family protein [Solirubrobacteraceae bacterium]